MIPDFPHRIPVSTSDGAMLSAACEALTQRRPDLFVVGEPGAGAVVELTAAGSRPLSRAAVIQVLSDEIDWIRESKDGDVPVRPPESVAELLCEGRGSLRHLAGITSLPLLRPDGSVHAVAGWDATSGLYVRPGAERLAGAVGGDPRAAAGRLLQAVHGAPWESDHDGWSWLAHALTIAARPLIAGPAPLWIYDATQAGSGKTTLARVSSWMMTGVDPIPVACSFEKQDLERMIGPRADDAGIVIDNVTAGTTIRSSTLEAMLTAGAVAYDLKYQNSVTRPLRAVLSITMNGAQAGRDIARRSVRVSLSPGYEQTMPPGDLLDVLGPRREALACDALSIVRGWLTSGRPRGGVLSSFAAWSEVVGGCLALLGNPGWVDTVRERQTDIDTDDESVGEIVPLFAAWLAASKLTEATTAQILSSSLAQDLLRAVAAQRNVSVDRLDARAVGNVFGRSKAWTAHGRLACRKAHGQKAWRIDQRENRGTRGTPGDSWGTQSKV